jgi:hypothetical protein
MDNRNLGQPPGHIDTSHRSKHFYNDNRESSLPDISPTKQRADPGGKYYSPSNFPNGGKLTVRSGRSDFNVSCEKFKAGNQPTLNNAYGSPGGKATTLTNLPEASLDLDQLWNKGPENAQMPREDQLTMFLNEYSQVETGLTYQSEYFKSIDKNIFKELYIRITKEKMHLENRLVLMNRFLKNSRVFHEDVVNNFGVVSL